MSILFTALMRFCWHKKKNQLDHRDVYVPELDGRWPAAWREHHRRRSPRFQPESQATSDLHQPHNTLNSNHKHSRLSKSFKSFAAPSQNLILSRRMTMPFVSNWFCESGRKINHFLSTCETNQPIKEEYLLTPKIFSFVQVIQVLIT